MKWHYMCTPLDRHARASPVAASSPAPEPTVQAVASAPSLAPAPAPPPAPAPTPAFTANAYANWASASDPSSGKTYYYDTVTGETSWTWPPN